MQARLWTGESRVSGCCRGPPPGTLPQGKHCPRANTPQPRDWLRPTGDKRHSPDLPASSALELGENPGVRAPRQPLPSSSPHTPALPLPLPNQTSQEEGRLCAPAPTPPPHTALLPQGCGHSRRSSGLSTVLSGQWGSARAALLGHVCAAGLCAASMVQMIGFSSPFPLTALKGHP